MKILKSLLIVFALSLFMGASRGPGFKIDKTTFKVKERIVMKCSQLSKNVKYRIGAYKIGATKPSRKRNISGVTSVTKQFKAPKEAGKYKIKLTNKNTGKVYHRRTIRVTSGGVNPPVDPPVDPPGNNNKNFTASSGTTDLNYADTTAFINAYKGLGYNFKGYTKQVKTSQLKSFLGAKNQMHFNSGHGTPGALNCTDGNLNVSSLKGSVNTQYCIFATCLTLKHNGWYSAFGSNAKMIMGFTEITTDGSCLSMAKSFPANLKTGKTYLKAWYLTNSAIKQHQDRWATYVKENGKIIFYSAKGKHPRVINYGKTKTLSDQVTAYKKLLKKWKKGYFGRGTGTAILGKSKKQCKFNKFPKNKMYITESVAISEAYDSLGSKLPDNAVVDTIIPIERCVSFNVCSVVAYDVYFVQEYNGLPIRSGSRTNFISILVGENGIASTNKAWSKIIPLDSIFNGSISLSISTALKTAADDISNTIKKPVLIVDYKRVYGTSSNINGDTLIVPAYEFIGDSGERFVVNAYTGKLIH